MEDRKPQVIFQPSGCRGEVPRGTNLAEASVLLGVSLQTPCGGNGLCGKCKVHIEEGPSEVLGINSSRQSVLQAECPECISPQDAAAGFVLACRSRILEDVLVFVPEESRAGAVVISKEARDIPIRHDPAVKSYSLQVAPPSLDDPTPDFERVAREIEKKYHLNDLKIDLFALRDLPSVLREGRWQITVSVWMDREIIRVTPGWSNSHLGVAIDVGTTTLAVYLCDLVSMEVLNVVSAMNPQCRHGEDVMTRIAFHMADESGLKHMSDAVMDELNRLLEKAVGDLREENGRGPLDTTDIEDLTIVGNTAMHHILFQLNPEYLGMAPFPPVIHQSMDIKARDLGLKANPSAYGHTLPNISSFVGSDTIGVLIAEEPHKGDQVQLIVDIGTNGELVIGNKDILICCSCATGPALEGARILFGMRAAQGAIERVSIDPVNHEVDYKVVGRIPWLSQSQPAQMLAKGICGSGILDAVAELYTTGVIAASGAFRKDGGSPRVRLAPRTNQPEFVLAWAEETGIGKDIVITQNDIRQVQLAKGAIQAGCRIMMRRLGIERLECIKISGAFGCHLDRLKALALGLVPDCDSDRLTFIGNAAGDGARIALLDRQKRAEADRLADRVEHIELTLDEGFQQEFMKCMYFPYMRDGSRVFEDVRK